MKNIDEKQKIFLIVVLTVICFFLTYYFHVTRNSGAVFSHLFYIPILLSCIWWRRKGIGIAIILASVFILSHIVFRGLTESYNDYYRAVMFVVVACFTAFLSERLTKSLQLSRTFLNATTDGAVLMDSQGIIHDVNDVFAKRFHKSSEEMIGLCIWDLFPADVTKNRKKNVNKVFESGEPVIMEDERNGLWSYNKIHPIFDSSGEVIQASVFSHDITERKRVEEALRKSEERFRTAFEDASTGIALMANDGYFMKVNQTLCRLLGYSDEELQGKTWIEITSPDDLPSCYDWLKRVKAGEQSSHEKRFIHKLGHPVWVEVSSSLVRDSQGRIQYYISLFQDIMSRKQAEEALRKSEEKYRSLVDSTDDWVWACDIEGRQTFANDAVKTILGYDVHDIEGILYENLIHPEDQIKTRQWLKSSIEKKKGWKNSVVRYLHKDGTIKFLESTAQPSIDSKGNLTGFIGIDRDITDRKQMEVALRESHDRLDGVLTSLNDAILLVDPVTRLIIGHNDATTRIFGYSHEELIGKDSISLHVDQAHYEQFGRKAMAAYENPGFYATEFEMQRKDGGVFPTEHFVRPVRTPDSLIGYVVSVVRDITERKRLEEELLSAQKLESLGVFAGGIAHDFNNILTMILGNVSMAKMGVPPEYEMFDLLNEAEIASTRAQMLTKQLLTFAKGGAPVKETASIKAILKESSSFVLRGSKSGCEFSIAEDLWPAEVDVGQISQVINNVVINADQAMPEGGIIQVVATNLMIEGSHGLPVKPGRYINISISDQGVGIAENHLLNIFDPYFTTKHAGNGLGLATTYSITKRHDGHITVESQLGHGTTLHIYLHASEKAVPEKKEVKLIKGQGRILVMDDVAALRKIAGRILEKLGYEPEFAKNGAEAIRMYKEAKEAEKPYDAVILDLTIPGGMGGKDAVNKLLEIDPEVKAIVSSGYSDDPVLSNFQEYGFKGMMPKPFTSQSLSKVLHEVLQGEKE